MLRQCARCCEPLGETARFLGTCEKRDRARSALVGGDRPDAPTLLRDELEHCFDLLEQGAGIGELWGTRRGVEIFRVVLKRTNKKLYFSRPTDDVVRVLSLWGAQRGQEPKL